MSDASQADTLNDKTPGENIECTPYVIILEQPTSKALRFRYDREFRNRNYGSIPGANSTANNKTYPTIKIMNYDGPAMVTVSCVTSEEPYMPHPYKIVGNYCNQGVCTVYTKRVCKKEKNVVVFSNINIECLRKKEILHSLDVREELRVDPFQTGFDHKYNIDNTDYINLSAVRLCFQVFVEGSQKDKFNVPLLPVVSNLIYDNKVYINLVIRELCTCSASAAGGANIILLCERVVKDDIEIKFFEEQNGVKCWEGYGVFEPMDVHKQTAIKFKTPKFYKQDLEEPAQIYVQLRRPSDGATSEPLPFQMLPLYANDFDTLRRKRKKFHEETSNMLFKHIAMMSHMEKQRAGYTTHFGDKNKNNRNLNEDGNLDTFAKDSTLQSMQPVKPFVQKYCQNMESLKQQSLEPTLSPVVSNYNESLRKQHETNIAETQQWDLQNDQFFLCVSNQSKPYQSETDMLNTLSEPRSEYQYKTQFAVTNNNMATNTRALNADNSTNLTNFYDLDKQQTITTTSTYF